MSTAIQRLVAKRENAMDMTGPHVLMSGYRAAAWGKILLSFRPFTSLMFDLTVCFGMAIIAVVISLLRLSDMEIIKYVEPSADLEPRTSLAVEMDVITAGERREKEGSVNNSV